MNTLVMLSSSVLMQAGSDAGWVRMLWRLCGDLDHTRAGGADHTWHPPKQVRRTVFAAVRGKPAVPLTVLTVPWMLAGIYRARSRRRAAVIMTRMAFALVSAIWLG